MSDLGACPAACTWWYWHPWRRSGVLNHGHEGSDGDMHSSQRRNRKDGDQKGAQEMHSRSGQCCACHCVVIDTRDLVTFSHDQSHASGHLTSAERENLVDGPPSSGSTSFDGHQ